MRKTNLSKDIFRNSEKERFYLYNYLDLSEAFHSVSHVLTPAYVILPRYGLWEYTKKLTGKQEVT